MHLRPHTHHTHHGCFTTHLVTVLYAVTFIPPRTLHLAMAVTVTFVHTHHAHHRLRYVATPIYTRPLRLVGWFTFFGCESTAFYTFTHGLHGWVLVVFGFGLQFVYRTLPTLVTVVLQYLPFPRFVHTQFPRLQPHPHTALTQQPPHTRLVGCHSTPHTLQVTHTIWVGLIPWVDSGYYFTVSLHTPTRCRLPYGYGPPRFTRFTPHLRCTCHGCCSPTAAAYTVRTHGYTTRLRANSRAVLATSAVVRCWVGWTTIYTGRVHTQDHAHSHAHGFLYTYGYVHVLRLYATVTHTPAHERFWPGYMRAHTVRSGYALRTHTRSATRLHALRRTRLRTHTTHGLHTCPFVRILGLHGYTHTRYTHLPATRLPLHGCTPPAFPLRWFTHTHTFRGLPHRTHVYGCTVAVGWFIRTGWVTRLRLRLHVYRCHVAFYLYILRSA